MQGLKVHPKKAEIGSFLLSSWGGEVAFMKQVYRALWNVSNVIRKHYFTCEDHELLPRQALEQELQVIGEPIPEQCFIERLGLPYDEVPNAQERVCYRLAYQRLSRSTTPSTHYIITFYAHNEQEARSIADFLLKQFKKPYREESFTRYLVRLLS